MDIEFFEPAEAAALMRCTESWLRDGATSGRFPHACWGMSRPQPHDVAARGQPVFNEQCTPE